MKKHYATFIRGALLVAITLGMQGCATKNLDETSTESVPEVQPPIVQEPKPEIKDITPPAEETDVVKEAPPVVSIDCSDFKVIGQIEPVAIVDAKMTLPARIDTGATTSSLDARDIKPFERDGKKWVRFFLVDRKTGKEEKMEAKLARTAVIKRHGAESQTRIVVKLKVKVGGKSMNTEFSLTDRSDFEFPVLVGRNILEAGFAVDVRKKNTSAMLYEE